MSDPTWRAFIGEWPGDYRTHTDQRGLTWEQARDVLAEFARAELEAQSGPDDDVCLHCRAAAETAAVQLAGLPTNTGWIGDIDWDELRLIREDTP